MITDPLVNVNFQLEQDIIKCWNVTDDVREVLNDLESGHMSQENAVAALRAFTDVYDNRFDRTFRRYETVCRGLHDLRAQVAGFASAQTTQSKSGKMGKSKKHEPVDTKSESC
jgi:hypothetical protein